MERPRLKDIDVGGFLSYGYQTLRLGDATFLVGRNGAGKSNLVRAVWMLGRAVREPLTTMLSERGGFRSFRHRSLGEESDQNGDVQLFSSLLIPGSGKCEYRFILRPLGTEFQVRREIATCGGKEFHRVGSDWFKTVSDFAPLLSDDALALPLVAGLTEFSPLASALDSIRFVDVVPERLRDYQNPDSGHAFKHDGSNAASVLREMVRNHPDRHGRLCEFLSAAVPGVIDIQPKSVGSKLTLEFTQSLANGSKLVFEAISMSDGTLRIFGILLALLQPPDPMVVVIEEPEAAVHVGALAVLLDAMNEAKLRSQLLITTQSPDVLDADWIAEDDIRIVQNENGLSRFSPLANGTRDVLRRHLFTVGELLRDNALIGESAAS